MRLRHPLRCGHITHLAGEEVRLATLEEVRLVWPKMEYKPDSQQVAIWLPENVYPMLIARKALIE